MEEMHSGLRRWEEMDTDILVRIFESMNVIELTSGIGQVCRTWRLAVCDPSVWKTVDMTMLTSKFIKIPLKPYVYVSGQSDKTIGQIMKAALSLSCGNTSTLIFHYNMYLNDDHFAYMAGRCPRLKRLIMPAWNRIKGPTICQAIRAWEDLESLTMPSISTPKPVMEAIGHSCKRFSELKVMESFDVDFASTITAYLPNLKVLSLRCTMLFKDALIVLLENLKSLEVLNISHCLLVEARSGPGGRRRIITELDNLIFQQAHRLKQFLTCNSETCVMCQRARTDEGLIRWYKYEEDLWKFDEVSSLAI